MEHGLIDGIVARKDLRHKLGILLGYLLTSSTHP
jgi:acetyl-CoA carboxylase beta subunit